MSQTVNTKRTKHRPFSFFLFLSISILSSLMVSLLFMGSVRAAQVTLAWDASNAPNVAGYNLYYGNAPRNYQTSMNVGNQTRYTFSGGVEGATHYFAATAYDGQGNESDFSEELACITIEASASPGGAISPQGTVVINEGGSKTLTITPDANYHAADVLVDGVSVGAVTNYTFSNTVGSHTIVANFTQNAPTVHTITSSAQTHGTISPSGQVTVSHGGGQSFTITADTSYHVADVLVDGASVGALSSYTFSNVTGNHSITAMFAINTYSITSSAQTHGTISPSGQVAVSYSGSQSFTITADTGYHVADVLVDGASVGAVNNYTFYNVTGTHSITTQFADDNRPPVADAGPDQTIEEGITVALDSSNSTDPENHIVSYLWVQTGGTHIDLSDSNAIRPTFTSPSVGTTGGEVISFKLTVTDDGGLTSSDNCIVNVIWVNEPPQAEAGPDQTVNEWTTVILDGSNSTDPDDGINSYRWKQITGPAVTLVNKDTAQASFVAMDVGPTGTSLKFELTVNDYVGLQAIDTVVVNVIWVNQPPQAEVGSDQTKNSGEMVTLDGSRSNDPDDGIASFRWKQANGPPVTLSDPTAVQPTFVAPSVGPGGAALTFTLAITDNGGLTSTDGCAVSVRQNGGPDLTGSWQSFSLRGQKISGKLRVNNTGQVSAGKFWTAFYLSDDGKTPGTLLARSSINSLRVARATTLGFSYSSSVNLRGKYIIAVIDSDKQVSEANETNNTIVGSIR